MTFEPEVEDCQVQRREMSGAPSEDEIRSKWPLHWLVWKDDHKALKRLLAETESLVGFSQLEMEMPIMLTSSSPLPGLGTTGPPW